MRAMLDLHEDDARVIGPDEAVVDTVFGPAVVDVGRLTARTQHAFAWGQCHALAGALHAATGWTVVAVGRDECEQDLFCGDGPDGMCTCAVRHLAVVVPGPDDEEATLLDAFGPRPVSLVVGMGEDVVGLDANGLAWVHRNFLPAADAVAVTLVPLLLAQVEAARV